MESPASLINKIISISLLDPRIEAVILTGSRAREQDIDSYSDIDIELIGHGTTEIFKQKSWINQFGEPLVALHLLNLEEDAPDWPTCLVIFKEGRKVDFTFAEPERLSKMKQGGLDATFSRGFAVLLDKTGITEGLPESINQQVLTPPQFTAEQFTEVVSDFWHEAHQVTVALTRDELWVAWSRSADMKQYFLTMIERLVAMQNDDVWYKGRNYHEWMPKKYIKALEIIFNCGTAHSAALSLQCLMRCFNEATTELASLQGFDDMQLMAEQMQELLIGILQDNALLPEIL
ncbi:aminoglycoside 6-adenylyltransferase [Providencia huaxiensis]|uniref:Aminoglycoside 6-adenylyltransferase n=1 Tax=Providencia huaxiensis TaxID=2027290 RepID=A0ABU2J007_9GAMM|nr:MULTISPECIES: aminoglycoside 6-adenylyltransferase [Providencia]MBZ3681245.1 aminoglycoside 6-adenylyltransferase [Providencia rettgeri]AXH62372.1 aminoglycoside 6-adenylyltransferase [Providencia huaxiensis]MBQ0533104.1 aminoglycoside 6-adenylyltransferase [Providencia huaxiensis]MBQ0588306.1 aminoglycoside 6-adenylyltransferase [Providencia huaxiensis]MDI7238801.1 aminoglycoside 6-adenylyltransferase [Providencia huaxiensis]